MEFRLIFRSFEILRMFCKTCLCPTVNNSNLLYCTQCTVQSRRIMATDLIFPLGITGPDLISSWNYFLHCIRILPVQINCRTRIPQKKSVPVECLILVGGEISHYVLICSAKKIRTRIYLPDYVYGTQISPLDYINSTLISPLEYVRYSDCSSIICIVYGTLIGPVAYICGNLIVQ